MRLYETLGRSGLAAGIVLSLLLHALLLALFPQRGAFHPKVSESIPSLPLQTRLRPRERQELSTGGARVEGARQAQSRRSGKSARKPAADAPRPLPAPPAADSTRTQAPPGPSDEAAGAPVLDLEAAKRIALEADRARERSLSELPALDPSASDPNAALSRGIANAARADCRTAHAGKGLLAIPFLIFDAITDNGCKW
jgi:hypothetical protein